MDVGGFPRPWKQRQLVTEDALKWCKDGHGITSGNISGHIWTKGGTRYTVVVLGCNRCTGDSLVSGSGVLSGHWIMGVSLKFGLNL